MIARFVLVALATALPAQDLRVVTCLPAHIGEFVREQLDAVQRSTSWRRVAAGDIEQLAGDAIDVLFGVPGHLLARMALAGQLDEYRSPAARELAPFHTDPAGRFIVPFAWAWTIAVAPAWPDPPRTFDDLLDPRFTDRLVVCSVDAAPDLYAAWIAAQTMLDSEARAFAWLAGLDARVSTYVDDPLDARSALHAGQADVAVLPDPLIDASLRAVRVEPVPLGGLGLALVGGTDERAREVYDALLSRALASDLASRFGLLPCPASDGRPISPGTTPERAMPYVIEPNVAEQWFTRWRESVRDRGRDLETLDTALDLVFTAAFIGFMWLVYTRLKKSEG